MKKFDVIVFDVDSTVAKIEGIDFLAKKKPEVTEQVVELTELTMNGILKLDDVFVKKVDLVSPSKKDLEELGQVYCEQLVEDIEEVINILHSLGKEVWLLSGSFYNAIKILANRLAIADDRLITNQIIFKPNGDYLKVANESPLIKNGAKGVALKRIKGKTIVHVGDGVTDLEVKDVVNLFVGFGGISKREKVYQLSDVFISSSSIAPLLLAVLTEQERQKLSHPLLKKAMRLYDRGYLKLNLV